MCIIRYLTPSLYNQRYGRFMQGFTVTSWWYIDCVTHLLAIWH